jgi:hypothetical protein
MRTPQIKPTWKTGVHIGNGVIVPEQDMPILMDDGTLDTVVEYQGKTYRFMSEFRYEFDSDDAFLAYVKEYADDDDNIPFVEG